MGAGASASCTGAAKPPPRTGLFGTKKRAECRLLVLGLDNSGKTTVIAWLKSTSATAAAGSNQPLEVVPTVGFQLEEFCRGAFNLKVFDMSGQSRYRELWGSYFREAQGVLFVVDATDRLRMVVAQDELRLVLEHEHVQHRADLPFAFLANKMDLGGAIDSAEMASLLGVDESFKQPWLVVPTCAATGDGIETALTWITEKIAATNGPV